MAETGQQSSLATGQERQSLPIADFTRAATLTPAVRADIQQAFEYAPDFTRAATLTPAVRADIQQAFEYAPWDAAQTEHGLQVRIALQMACEKIIEHVPPSPDRSAAIRKLREARMDCNSAITHGGRY